MKTITYNKAMKMQEEGTLEIEAWDAQVWEGCTGKKPSYLAHVAFHPENINKPSRRETVIIKNCPAQS